MQIITNIHQISLGYVNAYLIVEEGGLTLIDAGMSFHYKKLLSAIKSAGFDPAQLNNILLTHGDPDHAGCVNKLRKIADFKVYASQITAASLAQGKPSRALKVSPIIGFIMRLFEKWNSAPINVDEVIEEGDTLPILDGIQVIATPGHTPGHLSFYFPTQKLLIAGDSMRANEQGLQAGDIKMITWDSSELFDSIKKQSTLGAEIVVVGHGPITTNLSPSKFPTS